MASSYNLPLDIIPTSQCSGSFSTIRTSTTYTGPTINVRRSSDNSTSDFYSNAYGQFGTILDGSGTTLETWLGTSTGYIRTWYDQSGKNNHATQTNTSFQPTFDIINNQVDFTSGTSFFNIPDGTAPNKSIEGIYKTAFNTTISFNANARTTLVTYANTKTLNSVFDAALTAYVTLNGGAINWGNGHYTGSYLSGSRTVITNNEFNAAYSFYDGDYTKGAVLTFRLLNNIIDVYESQSFNYQANVTSWSQYSLTFVGGAANAYNVTNISLHISSVNVSNVPIDPNARTTLVSEPAALEDIYDEVIRATVLLSGAFITNASSPAKYLSSSRTPIINNQFSVVYSIIETHTKCVTITFRVLNNMIDIYQSNAFYYLNAVVNDFNQTAIPYNEGPAGPSGYGVVYFSTKINPSKYTVIVKHGDINNSTGCYLGSGGSGAVNNTANNFSRTSLGYVNSWYGNNYTGNNVYNSGNVVTYQYDGSYSYLFVNNAPQGISPIRSGWIGQKGNEFIGRDNTSTNYFNGKMSYLFLFKTFLSVNDRSLIERGMYTFNSTTPFKFSKLKDACSMGSTVSISQAGKFVGLNSNISLSSSFSNFSLRNGLFMRLYYGMNCNNNPNFFNSNTPSATGVTTNLRNTFAATCGFINSNRVEDVAIGNVAIKMYYSAEWCGLFYAPTSGTYTFYLSSDDSSYLWIGDNALSGYTLSNCLVNSAYNGGIEVSGSTTLVAGQYYPIRVQFGDFGGGEFMKLRFSLPNGLFVYEGNGYFYCQAYPSNTYTNTVSNAFNSNLSMHYTFETSDKSGTTLLNNGTNSYDSTLYGGANITSNDYKVGLSSLLLSAASSQYVQLPSFTPTTNGLTFSFWYRSNGNGSWAQIFAFANGAPNDNILCSPNGEVTNGLSFTVYNGSTRTFVNLTDINYNDNQWRHVVWTLTYYTFGTIGDLTSTWNIYINGVLKTTTTNRYPSPIVTRTLCYLGRSHWAGEPYFNGNIDDFRVYNCIFSSDEVTNLYINNVGTYTNIVSNSNLIMYYPFESSDKNGTTLANNANTLSYDATLYNGATVSSGDYKVGPSLSSLLLTAASSQYVQTPNFTPTTNGLSFSFWYRSNGSGSWGRVFDFGSGENNSNILCSPNGDNLNKLGFRCNYGATATNFYLTDINYNDNVWRHVAWTLTYASAGSDKSVWNIYINGVYKATNTHYYPDPAITRTLCYLGKSNWADGYYNGYIDDFRIYNRVLSANDVLNLYSNNNQTFTNLVSNRNLFMYYPFETSDKSGTTLANNANQNNFVFDATLYNGATVNTNDYKVGLSLSSLSLTAASSQYVKTANFTPTTNGLSFSFWYKSNASGLYARIFDFANGTSSDNILISTNGANLNYLHFNCFNGASNLNTDITDINYNDNVWRHVVWTLTYVSSGTTSIWNIYVNGILKKTTSGYYPLTSVIRANCYLGRSAWSGDGYYNGYIDDFRAYHRVLTSPEVKNIYSYTNNTVYNYAIKNGNTTITTQVQGTTPQNPATSGYSMYLSNPWLPNNYYWIKSPSMTVPVQMYVDIKSGGFDYYNITGGIDVSLITQTQSGSALGLELMVSRSQTHWKSINDYLYNVLGSNQTTYLKTFGVYNSLAGNYTGYAMFDPRYGNSGSTTGSYNGSPDWRAKDGGLWYIKHIPFGEPNGDYVVNAFLGTYGDTDYTYGIPFMTSYGSPGFNDGNAGYSTGSNYIVSTNYAGSTVSTLYTYLDGSTSDRAAPSALYIKNQTGTNTNGIYWINLPIVGATQVYCIMDSVVDGGGWMMAMKATSGTTFQYSSSHWTTVTTLNSTDNTRNDADAKFHTMNYFQSKDMLALWPDIPYNYNSGTGGSLSLSTYNNWCWMKNNYNSGISQSLINYFSSASDVSFGTAKGVERGTAFSSQGGNMFYGTNFILNQMYGLRHARWGFGWNNETDWISNDSTGGIGLNNPTYSAGDFGGHSDQTGINRSARVEIYVR